MSFDAGLAEEYSADDGTNQLSWHLDSSYIGTLKWDAFLTTHHVFNDSNTASDRQNSFVAQMSVNRYVTRRLFLFPYVSLARDEDGKGNRIFAQFYGGGAGWAFWRDPKRYLYFNVGMVGLDATGTVTGDLGAVPYHQRAPASIVAVSAKITVYRGIELIGRVQYLQPLDGTTWRKVLFDNAVHVPLTEMLALDFRAYNPPNVTRPGALTVRDLKLSTGLAFSF